MRSAVCLSLPVAAMPVSSIVVSVTFTVMLSLERVGSFCSAPSICDFRLLASAGAAFTSLCGSPLAVEASAPVLEDAVVPALALGVVAVAVED